MDTKVSHAIAELRGFGVLSCTGDEARAFLHAQLTSDIAGLDRGMARRAGWCSAKGRLLATLLVVPRDGAFLLQLSRDIAPAVAKRLSMFILRAKVRITDESEAWTQLGIWGAGAEQRLAALGLAPAPAVHQVADAGGILVVRVDAARFLVLAPAAERARLEALAPQVDDSAWRLEEIRAGVPRVSQPTQDLFVPQMVNLERLGAVDFKKGCYPGQEIVARTQYRGVLKRRMARARVAAAAAPGDDVYADDLQGQAAGTVVDVAPAPDGQSELLFVAQISSLEGGRPLRLRAPDGPALEPLPLPYA